MFLPRNHPPTNITNLGVVVGERRHLYQVLSIRKYESSNGTKVEAVLSMTDEMGQRFVTRKEMKHNISIIMDKKDQDFKHLITTVLRQDGIAEEGPKMTKDELKRVWAQYGPVKAQNGQVWP